SYKQMNDRTLHGTHEVSVEVADFETADVFLQSIGLVTKNYQETKRESWRLDDFEIELDEWPWGRPYSEIACPDESALNECAVKLDMDWSKVCHGSVEVVYRGEYDITDDDFNNIPSITFEEAAPAILASKH